MSYPYPAGPAVVPTELTRPSKSYRRHAWLAMTGLVLFMCLYFGLLGWLCWTSYRLLSSLSHAQGNLLPAVFVGCCSGFLALFLAKALVFLKRGHPVTDLELKASEHPKLFSFLYRLADEAGAPRPHRVFVSARVNAAVFYDLTILSLIFPTRKNLEIGLGLVNVLNISEFKAVLAHEFGHFAQRSMAVGRWVYTAQQIASHLIANRDALDGFLAGLSRIDLRVAWIGWLLSLIVWAIRSLIELVFRVVIIAQRALSREMEYQADLVAASLTGSDALVHALHRLNAADEAWNIACNFVAVEANKGRAVGDIFEIQTRAIEKLRLIRADAHFGVPPTLPAQAPEQHRVFRAQLAQPPMMWSTHPANTDREQNVKRVYLPAPIDDASAWLVFEDVPALRHSVSKRLQKEILGRNDILDTVEQKQSLATFDEQFDRPSLDRRYRGAYLNRQSTLLAASPEALFTKDFVAPTNWRSAFDALYPKAYGDTLDALREASEEFAALHAIQEGRGQASGGVLRWRGSDVKRKQLPSVLRSIQADISELQKAALGFEQLARTTHRSAAELLDPKWAQYLTRLSALWHFVEHTQADLEDANGLLANTFAIVTADGKISAAEMTRLVNAANRYLPSLREAYLQLQRLLEEPATRALCKVNENLEEFRLPNATADNAQNWFKNVDSWNNATLSTLNKMARHLLDALLRAEMQIAKAICEGNALGEVALLPTPPQGYVCFPPGSERKLQTKLDLWDRFLVADGFVASGAKFGVAASIVGGVLFYGGQVGLPLMYIYNGLGEPVNVHFLHDGAQIDLISVAPYASNSISLPLRGNYGIATTIRGLPVEQFEADLSASATTFVYNVANAAALVEWTATYGGVSGAPERELGAPRMIESAADHLFEQPPTSISTKGAGETRTVLSAIASEGPESVLSYLSDSDQRERTSQAHARFDQSDSVHYLEWSQVASQNPAAIAAIVHDRLAITPNDTVMLRLEQQINEDKPELAAICERQSLTAKSNLNSGDWQYLSIRCMPEGASQQAAFVSALKRFPENPWLAFAVARSESELQRWQSALKNYELAAKGFPGLASPAATDVARILRLLSWSSAQAKENLDRRITDLVQQSSRLRRELAWETPDAELAVLPQGAYAKLASGKLQQAINLAKSNEVLGKELTAMVAASDGATKDQIANASDLPAEFVISMGHGYSMLALAIREKTPEKALREALSAADPHALATMRYLDAIHRGKSAQDAEALLGPMEITARGRALAAAAVLLGEKRPKVLLQKANALLFASERPYFRTTPWREG